MDMARTPFAFACALILGVGTVSVAQQPAAASAKRGDAVVIMVNKVKADKKQQFEDYMATFMAALDKVAQTDPLYRSVRAQTRNLYPAKPNEDGTWTYVFLADPVVTAPKAYDMRAVLTKAYSEAEADRLMKLFTDSYAETGQQVLELVQHER